MLTNTHDPVKMMNINMNKHPVQPGQDLFTLWLEGFRKGYVCGDWKQVFIIDLPLNPVHEQADIFWGGQLDWFLKLYSIL